MSSGPGFATLSPAPPVVPPIPVDLRIPRGGAGQPQSPDDPVAVFVDRRDGVGERADLR